MEATGVTVAYGATTVLRDLNLRVARGEIYALLGGNGAGESTTLNAFLGFLAPQTGSVRVCGIDVAADPLAARGQLAYVPENVALYEHLSARENIDYFLRLAGSDGHLVAQHGAPLAHGNRRQCSGNAHAASGLAAALVAPA